MAEQPSGNQTIEWWRWLVTIAAASPVFLALGYGLAYLQELGYCTACGVPREFISLDLGSVFGACLKLLAFAIGLAVSYVILNRVRLKTREGRIDPIVEKLCFLLIPIIFILLVPAIFIFEALPVNLFIGTGIACGVLVVAELLGALVYNNEIKGYFNKLRAQPSIVRELASPLYYAERHVGRRALTGVVLLVMLLTLSYWSGGTSAKSQQEFMIVASMPESLVLRIYGDNLICAPFDRGNSTVERSFFVVKLDDVPRPVLKLEKVGPLKSTGL